MSTGDLGRLNIAENTDGSLAPIALLRWALVIIFLWFGGMKFTAYEANGIAPFIANSPFMSWLHAVFGIQGASYVIGIVELSTAAALIIGAFNAFFSALGAAMSTVTYVITLTFFASTPGVAEPTAGGFPAISAAPGQFLLKDLVLLAASVCLLAASVRHLPREPRQCDPSGTGAHGSLALTRLHSASCTAAAWIVSRGSGLRLDNRPAGTPASTKGDPSWRCASWPKRPTAIVAVGEAWRPWPPQVPRLKKAFSRSKMSPPPAHREI
jgi:uncharacterized membrane protein YkgB